MEGCSARQNRNQKRSIHGVCEYFRQLLLRCPTSDIHVVVSSILTPQCALHGDLEQALRRIQWSTLLLFLLLPLIVSCERQTPFYQQQLLALGTIVDISIYGADKKLAQQATNSVANDLKAMEQRWHAWQTSDLTKLNQQLAHSAEVPASNKTTPDPEILDALRRAKQVSLTSGSLFNPAIGKLIALWGFHGDDLPIGPPPNPDDIKALVAQHPTMQDLVIEGDSVRSTNPALQLDLAAFIKSFAVDAATEHLRKLGIRNAIVNAGGDLRAIGKHGDRPWRVGIRNPRGEGILASLETQGDECVFTSGDYERFYAYQGQRYHHIVDPRSGYPSRGATSATVIHQSGVSAYGASTALLVAGPTQWRDVARKMGIEQAMLVDAQGNVYMTPAMAKRIHFEVEPPPRIIVQP